MKALEGLKKILIFCLEDFLHFLKCYQKVHSFLGSFVAPLQKLIKMLF